MTKFDWGETGRSYIYHVEVGGRIYVGQSSAKNPGSRLQYRLVGPFVGYTKYNNGEVPALGKAYDEPELGEAIRKYGLKKTKVTYFPESNNYGLSDDVLRTFKEHYKTSKDNQELSNLDAAEILHILYYAKPGSELKLINKSMGGKAGSINVIEDKKIIKKALTKTMTPAQAYKIFNANSDMINKLTRLRDSLNSILFTDKWKQVTGDTGDDFEDLVGKINETIAGHIFAKEWLLQQKIEYTILQWAEEKLRVFIKYFDQIIPNLEASNGRKSSTKLTNEEARYLLNHVKINAEQVAKLGTYIYNVIANQLKSLTKERAEFRAKYKINKITGEHKDMFNKLATDLYKNKTVNLKGFSGVINISVFFDFKNINRKENAWWKILNSWEPANGIVLSEQAKQEISFKVFKAIYSKVADKDYYQKMFRNYELTDKDREKDSENPVIVAATQKNNKVETETWYFKFIRRPPSQTLSKDIHEAYRELGIGFVENQWNKFYESMVTIAINNYDKWLDFDDGNTKDPILYREGQTLNLSGRNYYIAHRFGKDRNWRAESIKEVEIY